MILSRIFFMWRGSDNKFVMNFDDDWPNARVIHLNKNYRSSQDIVTTANHFAECIPESKHKHYVESVADKDKFEEPQYVRYDNESEEANEIAKKIQTYINAGYDYKDIAILTRTNAQLQNFETALYRSEIPYTIVDGMSFIDRREIKIVLSYLRLVCDIMMMKHLNIFIIALIVILVSLFYRKLSVLQEKKKCLFIVLCLE